MSSLDLIHPNSALRAIILELRVPYL